jgi:transcription initiation factor IIE alpha subunit
MDNTLLKGLWKYLMPVPPFLWKKKIHQMARQAEAGVEFMTSDHHRVRNFIVKTLPKFREPLSSDQIAKGLGIDIESVSTILDDLEKNKFFIFRNKENKVSWAYPVTTERTPHAAYFSTGEKIYAA